MTEETVLDSVEIKAQQLGPTGTAFDIKEVRHELLATWINVSVALQIRYMRTKRGWSQSELGRRSGMSQEVISRLEQVRWDSVPALKTLTAIASAFDCSLDVRFVSWGEGLRNFMTFSPETAAAVPSFDEEVTLSEQAKAEREAKA